MGRGQETGTGIELIPGLDLEAKTIQSNVKFWEQSTSSAKDCAHEKGRSWNGSE